MTETVPGAKAPFPPDTHGNSFHCGHGYSCCRPDDAGAWIVARDNQGVRERPSYHEGTAISGDRSYSPLFFKGQQGACFNALESESMEARRRVKSVWEEFVSLIPPSIKRRLGALRKKIEGGTPE